MSSLVLCGMIGMKVFCLLWVIFYKKNSTRERYLFALCHSYKIKVEAKGICLLLSVILNKKRCGKVAC